MKQSVRKITLLIMLVLCAFVMAFSSACKAPEDPETPPSQTVVEGSWTYELNADNTYAISKYDGNETTITVPSVCEGITVTKILSNAFVDCVATTITVPSSVEKIEMGAFKGTSFLENLTIPFVGGDVEFDDSDEITLFGYVFGKTAYMDSVGVVQPLLFGIGQDPIFYVPQSLKKVTITGGKVYYGAFSNCVMLEEVNLPQGDADINSYTFENCINLKTVTIPEGVKRIGDRAFYGCESLETLNLPHSLEILDAAVFEDCYALKRIELPERLTNEEYGFEIGGVFKNCTSLAQVTVNPSNPAFTHYEGVVYNKSKTQIKVMPLGYSGVLTLPETISEIESTILEDINNCLKLEYIWFDEKENALYESVGGILYNKTKTQIVAVPRFIGNDESDSVIVVESTVTELPINTFEYCVNVKKVVLPEGLERIPQFAFAGCTSLEEVVIPSSVKYIGTYAFASCTSFDYFIITRNIASMGQMVFSNNDEMQIFVEYTREEVSQMVEDGNSEGVEDTENMWEPYWSMEFNGRIYYVGEWLIGSNGQPYPTVSEN